MKHPAWLSVLAALILLAAPVRAEPFATQATHAILVDVNSGAVLLEKNADAPIPPASMSKLMTINMVFEALASRRLSMEDDFIVSEKAWKMGGSKMFVEVGDRIRLADLLRGIIVQSGNDACIVVAEGLAGSEAEFARRMTRRGEEIGLENSTFTNATGWPEDGHRMSVRDLAMLSIRHVQEFPDYYPMYAEQSFTWEGITQRNRNPLLGLDLGADGLKTGHTEEAGYGLAGSAIRDGRRLVIVISGLSSARERAIEAERILEWGFREFETFELLGAGAEVGTAQVWIGNSPTVPVVVDAPVRMTAPFGSAGRIAAEIAYDGPVEAPIEKGQKLGVIRLTAPGVKPVERPVFAGAAVERGGLGEKLKAGTLLLLDAALSARDRAPEEAASATAQ